MAHWPHFLKIDKCSLNTRSKLHEVIHSNSIEGWLKPGTVPTAQIELWTGIVSPFSQGADILVVNAKNSVNDYSSLVY